MRVLPFSFLFPFFISPFYPLVLLFLFLAIVTLGKGLIDRGARNRLDTILYRCPLFGMRLCFGCRSFYWRFSSYNAMPRVDMNYSYTRQTMNYTLLFQ
ncbi:hypothetical protein BDV26DRAFT_56578 [Aspergillus bertholletiae]|uniref:Uncharacterized protein n=1 Tax=Aspergillus bertholletiae TaxID=1226010 RepID=A0A5N7AY79_9EURO|nr:hypothetical protein BDV26DRAFT_56578 [Aspergillus bertholletiae]